MIFALSLIILAAIGHGYMMMALIFLMMLEEKGSSF